MSLQPPVFLLAPLFFRLSSVVVATAGLLVLTDSGRCINLLCPENGSDLRDSPAPVSPCCPVEQICSRVLPVLPVFFSVLRGYSVDLIFTTLLDLRLA